MDVTIAEQKAFVFNDQLTDQAARERAIEKDRRLRNHGEVPQRPKTEEIQLTYSEKRYEPFWFVTAKATYIYERIQRYRFPITDPAIKHALVGTATYEPHKDRDSTVLMVQALERCEDVSDKTVYLDG